MVSSETQLAYPAPMLTAQDYPISISKHDRKGRMAPLQRTRSRSMPKEAEETLEVSVAAMVDLNNARLTYC